jgi:hypothetical protein
MSFQNNAWQRRSNALHFALGGRSPIGRMWH